MGGKQYHVGPEEKLIMHSKLRIIKVLKEETVFAMDLKEWEGQVNGEWHEQKLWGNKSTCILQRISSTVKLIPVVSVVL